MLPYEPQGKQQTNIVGADSISARGVDASIDPYITPVTP